jgi:hypothetical protein
VTEDILSCIQGKEFESMIKSVEITTRNYARGALRAFLEGKKNLNWAVGMIRSSGVRGQRLAKIFKNLENYGNPVRYYEALSACREQHWLD